MKKSFAVLLILALVLMMWPAAVGAESAEKVKLQFMGWEASVYETEANKDALRAFEEANPGFEVEYIAGPFADHHTRLMTMMAGNAAPDTFYMDPSFYRNFIDLGMLLDVTSIFETNFNPDELIDWSHQKMTVDGVYYGIDSCVVGNIVMVNRAIFEEAGIELPSSRWDEPMTWDEMIDIAKRLTIKDGDSTIQYGVYGFENLEGFEIYEYYNGVNLYNDEGLFAVSDIDAAIRVMEELKGLRTVHGVSPEASFMENSGMSANQMLQTGKVAMVFEGSYNMQELSKMGFEYYCVAPPVMEESKPVGVFASSYNVAAWSGTQYPEATMELMQYLCSEDFQLVFVRDALWMSNRTRLYDPANYGEWMTELHPEGFENLAELFKNANVRTTDLTPNASEVRSMLQEEIEKFFYQDQDAVITLENMTRRANEILSR